MKLAMFSTKSYDRSSFDAVNAGKHEIHYFEPRLNAETAPLAHGFAAVCVFVNDIIDASVLEALHAGGTALVALRCAGYNNVDLNKAQELGISIVRVPAYSPYAVAEHTLALMLSLNRKIHRAYNRVREGNFSLDGLLGFDIHGKTVGIIGTGRIGVITARLLHGFGCRLLASDPWVNDELHAIVDYVEIPQLLADSDIVSLHCPLMPQTHHLINAATIARMKPGVMLINTSRGALIDTPAAIEALKTGQIGALALDVYEEEADLFFEDLSNEVIHDDIFARLMTFPNVLITGHQAYFTSEALHNIAETSLGNVSAFEAGNGCANQVLPENVTP